MITKTRFSLCLLFCLLAISSLSAQNSKTSRLDPPLTAAQIQAAMGRVKKERYFHRVLDSMDQFDGAIIGLPDDQTISSGTEILAHKKNWYHVFGVPLNTFLDLIQRSHGQLAEAGDLERANELIADDSAALSSESGVTVVPVASGVRLIYKNGTELTIQLVKVPKKK